MGQSRYSRALTAARSAIDVAWAYSHLISRTNLGPLPRVVAKRNEAIHVARFGAYIDGTWGRAFPA